MLPQTDIKRSSQVFLSHLHTLTGTSKLTDFIDMPVTIVFKDGTGLISKVTELEYDLANETSKSNDIWLSLRHGNKLLITSEPEPRCFYYERKKGLLGQEDHDESLEFSLIMIGKNNHHLCLSNGRLTPRR